MDEEMFNEFFVEKWKWIMCIIKAHLFHDLYFVYVV